MKIRIFWTLEGITDDSVWEKENSRVNLEYQEHLYLRRGCRIMGANGVSFLIGDFDTYPN